MSRNPKMENQLNQVSVQGLLKLRNCADRLIAQKLRNERTARREQLTSLNNRTPAVLVSAER